MKNTSKYSPSFSTTALYIVTILTGGTSWYAAKLQLTDVPPVISLVYRFGGASAVLLLLSVLAGKKLHYVWRTHVVLAMLGGLGFSTAFILIYLAAGLITTGLIALAYSAVVVFNAINAIIFLKKRFVPVIFMAGSVGLLGISLVYLPEFLDKNWNWIGFVYAIIATVAFSLANIFAVYLQKNGVSVLPMTGISMSYGAIFLFAYALITGQSFILDITPSYIGSLIYLIFFPSVIGYTTYFAIVGRLGAERGAYTMLIVPLVALAISSVVEDYRPTIWAMVGVFMVLGGNYWIIRIKTEDVNIQFRDAHVDKNHARKSGSQGDPRHSGHGR